MAPEQPNPVDRFLELQGFLVVDGGLATELEARGCDLSDDLWSARILLDDPQLIRRVHLDYLKAGADWITTASYQASICAFERRGLSCDDAIDLLRRSVTLATDAREAFWNEYKIEKGRLRPLVAASIGPYGAYLADGSEYTGRYDLDAPGLREFHESRWRILAEAGPDLLACETIPSLVEAEVLASLMDETPEAFVTMSFSCGDAQHLRDGSSLADAVRLVAEQPRVVAVGVNCVSPALVADLVREIRRTIQIPIIVYPNSGEEWDAVHKVWTGVAEVQEFGGACRDWAEAGARLIGGCCRTTPEHVGAIRKSLMSKEELPRNLKGRTAAD